MQTSLRRDIPRTHCFEDAALFRELYSKLYNFDPQLSIYYYFLILFQSLNKVIRQDSFRLLNQKEKTRREATEILKFQFS